MTQTLVQFLRARLDDDEAFMRAAIRLRDSGAVTSSPEATKGAFALMDVVANDPDTVEALTVFTHTGVRAPGEAERVLAEVEAKRQIVDWVEGARSFFWQTDGTLMPSGYRVLGPLAAVYDNHPDYRVEWRP